MIRREGTTITEASWDRRVVGHLRGERPGPLVLVVGGLHGNEPGGVVAAERVIADLEPHAARLRGGVLAVRGNLPAGRAGVRFLELDLNRVWTDDLVSRARAGDSFTQVEEREVADLVAAIDPVVAEHGGPVVVLDLHSTSASGPPFGILADTPANRELARGFPISCIFGLDRVVSGAFVGWCAERAHAAMVLEGGLHSAPETAANLASAVYLGLIAAGVLASGDHPRAVVERRRLEAASSGFPRAIRVVHRHRRRPGDRFEMVTRFDHFEHVEEGELLARDADGEIRAPCAGYVLMPCYQEQGDDGFFLGVEIEV